MSRKVRKQDEMYSPPNLHFEIVLSSTDDEPRLDKEVFDSIEGRLLKESWSMKLNPYIRMRHGIYSSYLMEGNLSIESECSRKI
jgi:hypothetical protein